MYTIIIGLKVFLFDELKEKKENDNNCEQIFIFFAYMILFSTIKKNFGLNKKPFIYLQWTKNVVGSHEITNIGCIKFQFF